MSTTTDPAPQLDPHVSDDSRPSYICGTCWKGVIANQLGLLGPPIENEPLGPSSGGYAYRMPKEEIQGNAERGCRWCDLVLHWGSSDMRTMDSTSPVPPSESENIVEIRVGGDSSGRQYVSFTVNDQLCWFGYAYTTEDDPAAAHIPGRNLFCEVGSERALSLAKDLLHDCELNHSDCPPLSEPYSHLPTRVIDCSDPTRSRLFISNGSRARYIALSYVWGEDQTHKTTTGNIDSYTRCIEIQSLPQTIVDAIQVTHGLGIQYLWVDSLCIIQDSSDDKDHELARMSHVYSDAYMTIIAASANRVSEGFLQPRTHELGAAAIEFPFILPDTASTASGSVFLSSWLMTTPKYEPAREPVNTRGWCMQEHFLSPRKLIFARHTLQYSCLRGTRNIGGADNPHWISSERDPPPIRDLPKLSPSSSPAGGTDTREQVEAVRNAWKAIIENYCKRAVSHPSDKLVAVSSLAENFSDIVQSPYLAGLWARTLLPDLLWSKDRAAHFAPRPQAYRAPSWSWAAVDGAVNTGNAYFLSEDETVIAEIVRYGTVLKNPELPFGEVTSATLVLRASVVVDCVVLAHWAVYRPRDLGDAAVPEPEDGRAEGPRSLVDKRRMHEIGLCRLDSDDDGIRSGVKCVCVVPVYSRWEHTPGLDAADRVVQGLIVEPLDNACSQVEGGVTKYRRIGFFEGQGDVDEWLEKTPEIEIAIV